MVASLVEEVVSVLVTGLVPKGTVLRDISSTLIR